MTASQPNSRRPLVRAELVRLLDSLEHHLRPLLVVAVGTGMRFFEVGGVCWRDVDINLGTIALSRPEEAIRNVERRSSNDREAEPGENR